MWRTGLCLFFICFFSWSTHAQEIHLAGLDASPPAWPHDIPWANLLELYEQNADLAMLHEAVHLGQGRHFLWGTRCESHAPGCHGLALLVDLDEAGKVVKKSERRLFNAPTYTQRGQDFSIGAVTTLVIDGTQAILLSWTLCAKPEPALGPPCESYHAILRANDLQLLWEEPTLADGAGAQTTCNATLSFVRPHQDQPWTLRLLRDCWAAACRVDPQCGLPRHQSQRNFYFDPATATFVAQ